MSYAPFHAFSSPLGRTPKPFNKFGQDFSFHQISPLKASKLFLETIYTHFKECKSPSTCHEGPLQDL